jgi:hypothetical protein
MPVLGRDPVQVAQLGGAPLRLFDLGDGAERAPPPRGRRLRGSHRGQKHIEPLGRPRGPRGGSGLEQLGNLVQPVPPSRVGLGAAPIQPSQQRHTLSADREALAAAFAFDRDQTGSGQRPQPGAGSPRRDSDIQPIDRLAGMRGQLVQQRPQAVRTPRLEPDDPAHRARRRERSLPPRPAIQDLPRHRGQLAANRAVVATPDVSFVVVRVLVGDVGDLVVLHEAPRGRRHRPHPVLEECPVDEHLAGVHIDHVDDQQVRTGLGKPLVEAVDKAQRHPGHRPPPGRAGHAQLLGAGRRDRTLAAQLGQHAPLPLLRLGLRAGTSHRERMRRGGARVPAQRLLGPALGRNRGVVLLAGFRDGVEVAGELVADLIAGHRKDLGQLRAGAGDQVVLAGRGVQQQLPDPGQVDLDRGLGAQHVDEQLGRRAQHLELVLEFRQLPELARELAGCDVVLNADQQIPVGAPEGLFDLRDHLRHGGFELVPDQVFQLPEDEHLGGVPPEHPGQRRRLRAERGTQLVDPRQLELTGQPHRQVDGVRVARGRPQRAQPPLGGGAVSPALGTPRGRGVVLGLGQRVERRRQLEVSGAGRGEPAQKLVVSGLLGRLDDGMRLAGPVQLPHRGLAPGRVVGVKGLAQQAEPVQLARGGVEHGDDRPAVPVGEGEPDNLARDLRRVPRVTGQRHELVAQHVPGQQQQRLAGTRPRAHAERHRLADVDDATAVQVVLPQPA